MFQETVTKAFNSLHSHSRVISSRAWGTSLRNYALSRFPDRSPVGGRIRRQPSRVIPRGSNLDDLTREHDDPTWKNDAPFQESALWQESQRRASGGGEDSLRRLLLDNHTLVVTRSVGRFKPVFSVSP